MAYRAWELWKTNGDGVGTIQVQDINPGLGPLRRRRSRRPPIRSFSRRMTALTAANCRSSRWRDVSLQEQIDQLLLLLSAATTSRPPLVVLLQTARRLITMGNSQGNLTAARAQLMNFIAEVERLIAKGDMAPDKGAPLLQGAQDILEQIEGNHPVRQPLPETRKTRSNRPARKSSAGSSAA